MLIRIAIVRVKPNMTNETEPECLLAKSREAERAHGLPILFSDCRYNPMHNVCNFERHPRAKCQWPEVDERYRAGKRIGRYSHDLVLTSRSYSTQRSKKSLSITHDVREIDQIVDTDLERMCFQHG